MKLPAADHERRGARISIGLWVAALGGTGFVAGFFGPIALNPEANQGPLLGMFITGPGGALGGLIVGLLFRMLPVSNGARVGRWSPGLRRSALGTLWYCLPQPKVLGYVVDATVVECARPAAMAKDALARWQAAVARTTWATPPADWQQRALANVERDPGVVLTLNIARRAALQEHRKPWDFGRRTPGRGCRDSARSGITRTTKADPARGISRGRRSCTCPTTRHPRAPTSPHPCGHRWKPRRFCRC